jgi:ubiquitin C-terminal hydrolase
LIGVVHHYGEIKSGHHTAEVKNNSAEVKNKEEWFMCDDSSISATEAKLEPFKSKSAYMLFYKPCTKKT